MCILCMKKLFICPVMTLKFMKFWYLPKKNFISVSPEFNLSVQQTEIALNFADSIYSEIGSSVQISVEMTCSIPWHLDCISNSESYTVDWVWNSFENSISDGKSRLSPIFQLRLITQKGHTKLSPVAPFWVFDWVSTTERLNSEDPKIAESQQVHILLKASRGWARWRCLLERIYNRHRNSSDFQGSLPLPRSPPDWQCNDNLG